MTKIILSSGFWLTLAVFVALGYAFAADCPGSLNCADGTSALSSSLIHGNATSDSAARASDVLNRSRCASMPAVRGTDPAFPEVANWERGGSMFAPGFSLTMTRRPNHFTLCPGPVEIPETLVQ